MRRRCTSRFVAKPVLKPEALVRAKPVKDAALMKQATAGRAAAAQGHRLPAATHAHTGTALDLACPSKQDFRLLEAWVLL